MVINVLYYGITGVFMKEYVAENRAATTKENPGKIGAFIRAAVLVSGIVLLAGCAAKDDGAQQLRIGMLEKQTYQGYRLGLESMSFQYENGVPRPAGAKIIFCDSTGKKIEEGEFSPGRAKPVLLEGKVYDVRLGEHHVSGYGAKKVIVDIRPSKTPVLKSSAGRLPEGVAEGSGKNGRATKASWYAPGFPLD